MARRVIPDPLPVELIAFTGDRGNNIIEHLARLDAVHCQETCYGTTAIAFESVLVEGVSHVVCTCGGCGGRFLVPASIFPDPGSLIV